MKDRQTCVITSLFAVVVLSCYWENVSNRCAGKLDGVGVCMCVSDDGTAQIQSGRKQEGRVTDHRTSQIF